MPGPHMRPPSYTPFETIRLQQQAIGIKLRHEMEDIVNAPVPQEWLEILRKADPE